MSYFFWDKRLLTIGRFIREQIWIILICLALTANGYIIYRLFFSSPLVPAIPPPVQPATNTPEAPAGMVASSLNGVYLSEADSRRRVMAVMVDNLVEARPSAGLNAASIVWESLVEGGVTRFLAVYSMANNVTIGPVRSARDYFLPWVKEVDAVYAHSGGSPDRKSVV